MSDARYSIREATEEDYGELCEVFEEVDALHRVALPHVFREPVGPARSKEFISGIIANEDAALLVAEGDGRIIGLVYIIVREASDIPIVVPRRYAVIDAIVVRKRFRRSGVGRWLAERAHRWAIDKGVTQVELNVWEFNRGAIAFYERLGYTTAYRKMWRPLL